MFLLYFLIAWIIYPHLHYTFCQHYKNCLQVSFWGAPTHADITEFSNLLLQPKNKRSGIKIVWFLCYFNFERNYDVLKPKSPCFLLNKNVNFDKFETELNMENPTHMIIVLQLIQESQIKNETAKSLSLRKKKEGIFCNAYFVQRNFSVTFVFYLNV